MLTRTTLIFASACAIASAGVRSGQAEADWLATSKTYTAGQPVHTGIRLVVDKDWHTYWTNPGEAGMKISLKWDLPEGWTAGEMQYPVPKRFMTGELAGFGYEGTVVFPITLVPPANFTGEAKPKVKISWLTCNDASCIPGNAELELSLQTGEAAATPEAAFIEEWQVKVPRPADGMSMTVKEGPDKLLITLRSAPGSVPVPGDCEIYPVTGQIIDPKAKVRFGSDGGGIWSAEVPPSEYISKPVKELSLVLAPKGGATGVLVTWKAE